jgi:hypothetical protein
LLGNRWFPNKLPLPAFGRVTIKGFSMKNFIKLIGIIALAAVIGFSMTACGDSGGGGGGGNNNNNSNTPTTYTFTLMNTSSHIVNILSSADITPDSFNLTSGATKTVTSTKTSPNFVWSPADKVKMTFDSSRKEYTFEDK